MFAGFKVHPDKEHIIYPVGNTVIVEHITKNTQNCLSGHTNDVSCIAVSKDGKYIASGQVTYMGFKVSSKTYIISGLVITHGAHSNCHGALCFCCGAICKASV